MASRFPRRDPRLLVCSVLIAIGLVAIGIGFRTAVTGREQQGLPTPVESVDPIKGSVRVPAQSQIFVDLQAGYTGVLVVNGVELPTTNLDEVGSLGSAGQQVDLPPTVIYEPGNATLTFQPSSKAKVKSLKQGQNIVQVIFWKITEGRGHSDTYTWDFSVF